MDKGSSVIGLEYSVRWFEYHASQRQDVFKIFFVVCAGIMAASGFALQFRLSFALIPIGVLSVLSSLLFYLLDRRSRELIEIGEEGYVHFWVLSGLGAEYCPATRSKPSGGFSVRYRHAYNAMFIAVGLLGVMFALLGLFGVPVIAAAQN